MTLNLAQRSSKVIDFGTDRKRVHIFLFLVNSNLDPILHSFRDTAAEMSKIENFPDPTHIPAKIWGCSLWSRSVMLGSAESEMVKLISCEIIFAEFHPIWSRYLNVTDGRTDGRTTCHGNTALRVASRGKNWVPSYFVRFPSAIHLPDPYVKSNNYASGILLVGHWIYL